MMPADRSTAKPPTATAGTKPSVETVYESRDMTRILALPVSAIYKCAAPSARAPGVSKRAIDAEPSADPAALQLPATVVMLTGTLVRLISCITLLPGSERYTLAAAASTAMPDASWLAAPAAGCRARATPAASAAAKPAPTQGVPPPPASVVTAVSAATTRTRRLPASATKRRLPPAARARGARKEASAPAAASPAPGAPAALPATVVTLPSAASMRMALLPVSEKKVAPGCAGTAATPSEALSRATGTPAPSAKPAAVPLTPPPPASVVEGSSSGHGCSCCATHAALAAMSASSARRPPPPPPPLAPPPQPPPPLAPARSVTPGDTRAGRRSRVRVAQSSLPAMPDVARLRESSCAGLWFCCLPN